MLDWCHSMTLRPFQVISLFRITLACENLTGRQVIKKKKTEKKKDGLYRKILGKMSCWKLFDSTIIFSILKSVVYLFDSKPILAQKNQSCKSDFDITFDLLLKFCLEMIRKVLFFCETKKKLGMALQVLSNSSMHLPLTLTLYSSKFHWDDGKIHTQKMHNSQLHNCIESPTKCFLLKNYSILLCNCRLRARVDGASTPVAKVTPVRRSTRRSVTQLPAALLDHDKVQSKSVWFFYFEPGCYNDEFAVVQEIFIYRIPCNKCTRLINAPP